MHQLNCNENWLNLKINCFRCGSDLNVIGSGICPPEASGIFPNCKCSDGNVFDGVRKVCMSENRSLCPNGATGQRICCFFFFQMNHLKLFVFYFNHMFFENVQFRQSAKLLLWKRICIRWNLLVLPTMVFESNSTTVPSILLVDWTNFGFFFFEMK